MRDGLGTPSSHIDCTGAFVIATDVGICVGIHVQEVWVRGERLRYTARPGGASSFPDLHVPSVVTPTTPTFPAELPQRSAQSVVLPALSTLATYAVAAGKVLTALSVTLFKVMDV